MGSVADYASSYNEVSVVGFMLIKNVAHDYLLFSPLKAICMLGRSSSFQLVVYLCTPICLFLAAFSRLSSSSTCQIYCPLSGEE